jgi:hypothetical protein
MFYYNAAAVSERPRYVRLGATFEGLDQCTCRNDQALFVCTKCPAFKGCWLCAEKHLCSLHFAVEDAPHRCVAPVNAAVQTEVNLHRQVFSWMRQQMCTGKPLVHLLRAVYYHLQLGYPLKASVEAHFSRYVDWPYFEMPYSHYCLFAEDPDAVVFWQLRKKMDVAPKQRVLYCGASACFPTERKRIVLLVTGYCATNT